MSWPLISAIAITLIHIWAVWNLIRVWCQDEIKQQTYREDFE